MFEHATYQTQIRSVNPSAATFSSCSVQCNVTIIMNAHMGRF